MKRTLFDLCRIPSMGGFEAEMRNYILKKAEPFADEIHVDKLGNVLVYRKGKVALKKPLTFVAHMDEPGFLVKRITKDGMLQLMGEAMPAKSIIGKQLAIEGRNGRLYGICGMKADHLQTPEEQKKTPAQERLLIDIGCQSKEEAAKLVRPGNVVLPDMDPMELAGTMINGRGLASKGGCTVLLKLLEEEPACDCCYIFSVSGENWTLVAGKGALVAGRQVEPEVAVMLHGAQAAEGPGANGNNTDCRCGFGGAISLKDGDYIFDRAIRQSVTKTAKETGTKWQFQYGDGQVTGCGRFATVGAGCKILPISLPVRYLKGPAGVCDLRDLESMADLCRLTMKVMAQGQTEGAGE